MARKMQLWQEICRAAWELRNFPSRSSDSSRTAETLPPCGGTQHRAAMTDEGSLQGETLLLTPPGSSGKLEATAPTTPCIRPFGSPSLAPPGAYALPFARRRPHLDGSLVRELRAELGQSSSTFP